MGELIYMNEAAKPGQHLYLPEMGQGEPEAFLQSSLSYDGKHYFVDSPIKLKGRGIRLEQQYKEGDRKYTDWRYSYRVTKKAYAELQKVYSIKTECYLD